MWGARTFCVRVWPNVGLLLLAFLRIAQAVLPEARSATGANKPALPLDSCVTREPRQPLYHLHRKLLLLPGPCREFISHTHREWLLGQGEKRETLNGLSV